MMEDAAANALRCRADPHYVCALGEHVAATFRWEIGFRQIARPARRGGERDAGKVVAGHGASLRIFFMHDSGDPAPPAIP